MADFGWSASCIVEALKTSNKIRKALKDAGGAKEHYAETLAFFHQIDATFAHLQKHIENCPDAPSRDAIVQQLKLMEPPWKRVIASYLHKYEKSLGEDSARSKIRQMPRMVQYVVKDFDAVVRKEKVGVLEPLGIIRLLLSMDMMQNVKGLAEVCQSISDDMKNVGTSSFIANWFHRIETYAKTQNTAHGEQSEKLVALQQTIGQHREELTTMMNETAQASTSHSQQHRDLADSVLEKLKETTEILDNIGVVLDKSAASSESIKTELDIQATRLAVMEKDVQQFAREKTDVVTDTSWVSNANVRTTLTAISAFALGLLTQAKIRAQGHPIGESLPTRRPRISVQQVEITTSSSTRNQVPANQTGSTLTLETAKNVDQTQWIADFNQSYRETFETSDPSPSDYPKVSSGNRTHPESYSGQQSPQLQDATTRSANYGSGGDSWYCCQCKSGPHLGPHSFSTPSGRRCDGCELKTTQRLEAHLQEAKKRESGTEAGGSDVASKPSSTTPKPYVTAKVSSTPPQSSSTTPKPSFTARARSPPLNPCPHPGCQKVYKRSDALLNHHRKRHGHPGPSFTPVPSHVPGISYTPKPSYTPEYTNKSLYTPNSAHEPRRSFAPEPTFTPSASSYARPDPSYASEPSSASGPAHRRKPSRMSKLSFDEDNNAGSIPAAGSNDNYSTGPDSGSNYGFGGGGDGNYGFGGVESNYGSGGMGGDYGLGGTGSDYGFGGTGGG